MDKETNEYIKNTFKTEIEQRAAAEVYQLMDEYEDAGEFAKVIQTPEVRAERLKAYIELAGSWDEYVLEELKRLHNYYYIDKAFNGGR